MKRGNSTNGEDTFGSTSMDVGVLTLQLEEAVAFMLGPEICDEYQTRGGKGRSKAKDNTVL